MDQQQIPSLQQSNLSPRRHIIREGAQVESEELRVPERIFNSLNHPQGSALTMQSLDSPTRGATSCLGAIKLDLVCGEFNAYLFETTHFGNHVIALTRGDISTTDPLLVRLHSECITSETLGGCDCDCVEQLNGALQQIADEGRGILFYLRQEGRGAGYAAKGRDRMAVASSNDQLKTFDVYRSMGLPHDARSYQSLADIVYLLNIQAPLEVMTNNPDKLQALGNIGLKVEKHRPCSFPSNPHNAHYLRTKSESGHMMSLDEATGEAHYPWPVKSFRPYVLEDARRFRHVASYPLPLRPANNSLLLPNAKCLDLQGIEREMGGGLIKKIASVKDRGDIVRVEFDPQVLKAVREQSQSNPLDEFLGRNPYWFNDHIYHDSNTQLDFVVLECNQQACVDRVPLVRIQSESLLSRFPLKQDRGADVYDGSVQMIVENGKGMIVLYPEDGRGNGIAAVFSEQQMIQSGEAQNSREACEKLGISYDGRDYQPLARLIKHHYGTGPVDFILSGAESMEAKAALFKALSKVGVEVRGFHFVEPRQS